MTYESDRQSRGGNGPDTFITDGEGHVEADCGDEWHDQFETQLGAQTWGRLAPNQGENQ